MKKIRWGIVGPGSIANKFAVAIKNVECAELRAVAARSLEKGSDFAAKYGIPKVFCGYDSLALSDEVDAVYIATPHPFHKSCAELFLKVFVALPKDHGGFYHMFKVKIYLAAYETR